MEALPWSDSLSAERRLETWNGRAVLVVVVVERRRVERGRVRVRNDILALNGDNWEGCVSFRRESEVERKLEWELEVTEV